MHPNTELSVFVLTRYERERVDLKQFLYSLYMGFGVLHSLHGVMFVLTLERPSYW